MAGNATTKSGKAKSKTPKKKGTPVVKSKSITSFFSSGGSSSKKKKSSPTSVTSTPKAPNKNDKDDGNEEEVGLPSVSAVDTPLMKDQGKKGTPTKKAGKRNNGGEKAVGNDEVRRSPRRSAAAAAKKPATAAATKKKKKNVLPDSSDESSSDDEPITKKSSPKKPPAVKKVVKKSQSTPYYPIGTTLTKQFIIHHTRQLFTGTIVGYDAVHKFYSVRYEDGDGEEMTEQEVGNFVLLRELKRKNDAVDNGGVVDVDTNNNEEGGDMEDSDEEPPKKAAKKPRISEKPTKKNPPAAATTKKNALDLLSSGKPSRRTAKKQLNYADSDNEENELEDSDSEEEEERPKKKRVGNKKNVAKKSGGKKKKGKVEEDDDSDDFQLGSESEDDSFIVDAVESESEMMAVDNEDDSSDDEYIGKNKKKPAAKKTAAAAAKKKPAAAAKKPPAKKSAAKKKSGDAMTFEEMKAEKAKDIDVKKLNNPQSFPDDGPYVEPVGIDATGGIVEGIIGGMVQKVGKLLLASTKLEEEERNDGELEFPLKLNTACSGTDAPSIALGLVKECLDRLSVENDKDGGAGDHGFEYEHNMSCELEPFKQAYISRNFPDTKLFPDITKLTGGKTVTDVYGRAQTIPESNLFIAGTSCKDFSMLKSSHRKDIEDKGTSGETFLAAVEYLEQEQPKMAIFENVQNAPWEKMQEYIEGRIDLKDRNDAKGITGMKKGNADKDLKFEIDDQGRYVVAEVPKQIGARAGCFVEGFVRGDDDPNQVQPLKCKQSNKGKTLSLGELAKKHDIDLEEDKLVIVKKARYCTHLVKLDTREYGLPQTRNRKYLFVWRSDDPEDDLGGYIQLIMDHLKTPLLHSMEAFLLSPTHDRLRRFREALRSGQGKMVAKERAKELDFFDWELTSVKDLGYHVNYREMHGINERARWLTQWDTRGRRLVPPGIWPELVAMWNMRRLDLIDCFSAGVVRDAISR